MARRTRSQQYEEDSLAGNADQPVGQGTTGGTAPANPVDTEHQRFQSEMLQALSGMAQSMRDMQHQIQQALTAQPAPPSAPTQPTLSVPQLQPTLLTQSAPPSQPALSQSWVGNGRSFADFKKFAPAPFSGSSNPIDAERWVRDMEKAFMAHGSQEMERIRFATYLLQGEAYDWWLVEEQRRGGQTISWEQFKEIFFDKYFPRSVQRRMESEFLKLEQRNLSVAQYEAEFTRLARFAPSIVSNEMAKITRFTEGLRPRLMQAVNAFELHSYSAMVNKALVIERDMNTVQRDWEQQRKRKGHNASQPPAHAKKRGAPQAPGGQPNREARCNRCGNVHPGRPCRGVPGACFSCGKTGHKIATCPLRQNQQPSSSQGANQQQQQPPRTQGRVFALTQ